MLAKAGLGLRFNEHLEGDGPTVFAHACKMGLEGIVSKRKDSAYRSGRSPGWLKMKNPASAAVTREAEEDWGTADEANDGWRKISIDGTARSYRDQKPIAIEAAEHLKRKHPHQWNRGEGAAK
jgi:hypothetical protein